MKLKSKNLLFLYLLTGGKSKRVVNFLFNFKEKIANSMDFKEIQVILESYFNKKIKLEKVDKVRKYFDVILSDIEAERYNMITMWDNNYPEEFKSLHMPPLLLFYKGDLEMIKKVKVGIVGTRKASEYGKKVAFKLSKFLSERDIAIVSGLARGIDRFSHLGALDGIGGTIAILGNGIKKFYPYENKKLQIDIFENGLVLSEFFPDEGPKYYNFPIRNRIISALSDVVVVVEAGKRSGAMITVNYALEHGKDVLAVPGSIFSKNSEGTNKMISEGAYPLISIEEILNFVKIENFNGVEKELEDKKSLDVSLTEEEEKIYKLIFKSEGVTIDELIELTSFSVSSLSEVLFSLELKGVVESNGSIYKLKELEEKYE